MTQGVSADEMAGAIAQLRSQPTTMSGITLLDQHHGDLEEALEESLVIEYGGAMMGDRSLRETTLTVLRKELCGDEGFRGLVKGYLSKPKDAAILTGAIVYLLESVTLPFTISPAIATLVVLYILKVGLEIFCEQTKPDGSET